MNGTWWSYANYPLRDRSSFQVNEYKYEMERITRELQDAKRKHYEHKRREQVRQAFALRRCKLATKDNPLTTTGDCTTI